MPIEEISDLKCFHFLMTRMWHINPADVVNLKGFCWHNKSLIAAFVKDISHEDQLWKTFIPHIYVNYFKNNCLKQWGINFDEIHNFTKFSSLHEDLMKTYAMERGYDNNTAHKLWFSLVPYLSNTVLLRIKKQYYNRLCQYLINWKLNPNKFPYWDSFYSEFKTTLDMCQPSNEPRCTKELWHDVLWHLTGQTPLVDQNRRPYNNVLMDKAETQLIMLKKFT